MAKASEDAPYKLKDTKIVYQNPWIKVREDRIIRNGKAGIYSYLEVGNSVTVIAVDEQERICLIESYRHPIKQWVWELPGGGDDGDTSVLAAQRELEEETGITAGKWRVLGKGRVYQGLSTEYQVNVLATDLTVDDFVQSEDITRARKFVSIMELDTMIKNGELEDNQSLTAIYMYKLSLKS